MSWKVAKISRYSTLGTISDYVDDVNGFIIRVGFRDPVTGELYTDTKFLSFVSNLRPYFGKIKIGYYFTSQAINEEEAVEEAEYVLNAISEFTNDFPVFFDVDLGNIASTGRADNIDKNIRFNIYKAFSETVENSGVIVNYGFPNLINLENADTLGAVLVRKYADIHPEIPGVEIDGWEYAPNDGTLPGTSGVCPITVYNDIAGWEEVKTDISEYINSLIEDRFVYTGKQIKPEVYNPYGLIYGVDYNVFYKYNINVNEDNSLNQPTVTVYGLNSYSGTSVMHFSILPAYLSGTLILTPSSAEYTGDVIRPGVRIPGLNNNTDYIVRFQDNITVGNYLVTAIGRRNYTGTMTAKFAITPKVIAADMFILEQTVYTYTGEQIKPELKVKPGIVGDDYGDRDDGRFDYGEEGEPYEPAYDLVDYDGGEEGEIPPVQWLGEYDFINMISNYEVEYGENIEIGENASTIIVKGINNFVGEATIYFTIVQDYWEDGSFELEGGTEFSYTGEEIVPRVIYKGSAAGKYEDKDDGRFDYGDASDVFYRPSEDLVDYDGGEAGDETVYDGYYDLNETLTSLIEGVDYKVEYSNNVNVGVATVTITGLYIYTGVYTLNFNIHSIDITDSNLYEWSIENRAFKFTGEPIEPEILLRKVDPEALDPEYTITYSNNTNFGTGHVTITGTGSFTGSLTFDFQIVAGDLSTDCICVCGDPDEDGLYEFNNFAVYDKNLDRYLVPYEDYYFDNESYYYWYPYNPSYIRVYRKVTGYYNYTGELECVFPTRLHNVEPVVPKINGISVEIIFMNGGEIPEEDPGSNVPEPPVPIPEHEDEYDDDDGTGHSEKWIPTEDIFPEEKDITEDADSVLIATYPPGVVIKLYNCRYYSSPENPYFEEDRLTGSYYIYNYHVVENRVRMTRTIEQINLPGTTTGWVDLDDLYLNLDNIDFRLGDYVLVLKDIYRNPDGSGGILAKAGEYMYIVAIATALAWDFGDQDVVPFQTDTSNTEYDFVTLAGDEDEDDYGPKPEPEPEDDTTVETGVIVATYTDFEEPYDFNLMATEATPEIGYPIGLAHKKNQTPIGWAKKEYISTNQIQD